MLVSWTLEISPFYLEVLLANSDLTSPPNADEKSNPSTTTLVYMSPWSKIFIMYSICKWVCYPTWAHGLPLSTTDQLELVLWAESLSLGGGEPGCVNCLLGGGEEGRGYHLGFDQKGEVMVLLISCLVSTQAQSPRIHFRLSLSS